MEAQAPRIYGFECFAYVIRWIDADTVLVDPQIYRQDDVLRIRLRDVYQPEIGEEGEDLARAKAEADFPIGSRIKMTNDHIRWTYFRLEARIDRA